MNNARGQEVGTYLGTRTTAGHRGLISPSASTIPHDRAACVGLLSVASQCYNFGNVFGICASPVALCEASQNTLAA